MSVISADMLSNDEMNAIEEMIMIDAEEYNFQCPTCKEGRFHKEVLGDSFVYVDCPDCGTVGHDAFDEEAKAEELYELYGHLSLADF